MSSTDWTDRPFLGFGLQGDPIGGTPEDTVGIVGPPRCGKTSGLLIPTVLTWGGPALVTSTKADLVADTADRRMEFAASTNGSVMVYDPFRFDKRFPSVHWSPLANCQDASICNQRVSAMAAAVSTGAQDEEYWKSNTAKILRPMFYAAALFNYPLAQVLMWLDHESLAKEAVALLRSHESPSAQQWALGLDALLDSDSRTRDPLFATARSALEAASDPVVLESCSRTDIDVNQFLMTGSTLYIVGPSHKQKVIAPLIAGLVDSVAQAAMEVSGRFENGRLKYPLLLALDEVANIAPLDSLPSLVSEGGGRGIITVWAAQNLAQMRDRYGQERAKSILAATGAKIVFGGLSINEDLQEISAWAGEKEVPKETISKTPTGFLRQQVTRSIATERVPVLAVGELQQLRAGIAALFYRSYPLEFVRISPAGTEPRFSGLLGSSRYRAKPPAGREPDRTPAQPAVPMPPHPVQPIPEEKVPATRSHPVGPPLREPRIEPAAPPGLQPVRTDAPRPGFIPSVASERVKPARGQASQSPSAEFVPTSNVKVGRGTSSKPGFIPAAQGGPPPTKKGAPSPMRAEFSAPRPRDSSGQNPKPQEAIIPSNDKGGKSRKAEPPDDSKPVTKMELPVPPTKRQRPKAEFLPADSTRPPGTK